MMQQVQSHPQHNLALLGHPLPKGVLPPNSGGLQNQNYIMSDEEIAFDDWEKEAELMVISNSKQRSEELEPICAETAGDNPEQSGDAHEQHLRQIERIKNMSGAEFTASFVHKDQQEQRIEPFSALLKTEKDFIDLATNLSSLFKAQARLCSEKVLPESETVAFFEQFLLYLFPELQWESIEGVKEKTKIVKKQKKEEEAKVKKLREKEMRLKRGFNRPQTNQKQADIAKMQQTETSVNEGK